NQTAAEAGLSETSHTHALDDLSDVDAAAPDDGDVLTWDDDASEWAPAAPQAGASALDDLTDVSVPSPSDGQALVWDSGAGEWVAGDVTPDALAYAETIGDGIETDYAVIHDLGTTDVVVQVWDISGA